MAEPDTEKTRAALLKRYYALPVARQQLLQALAVHYQPLSATRFAALLKLSLIRETPTRFFSPASLAPLLKPLAAASLAGQGPGSGEWGINPLLAEPVTRHAVREGTFERLARAITELDGGRAPRDAKDAPRRLRLAIYRDDPEQLERLLRLLPALPDADGPGFWGGVLANPFDAAWMRRLSPPMQAMLLRLWLSGGFLQFHPAAPAQAYAAELSREDHPAALSLRPAVAIGLICRGRWDEAEAAIDFIPTTDPRRRELEGWRLAALGRDDEAIAAYEHGLAQARRVTGRRKLALRTLGGLFYPLALLRSGDPGRWRAAAAYLEIAGRDPDMEFPHACHWLLEVAEWRLGRRADAADIMTRHWKAREPGFFAWLLALAQYWVDPAAAKLPVGLLRQGARRAAAAGYQFMAEEQEALLAALAAERKHAEIPAPAADARPLFLRVVPRRAAWEASLDALRALAGEPDSAAKPAADKEARLVWTVGVDYDKPRLTPLEQTLGRSGAWSKGRPVRLSRLMQNQGEMAWLTEHDLAVIATLRVASWGPGCQFDLPKALLALAGHPLVFREDSAGVPLSVILAEPEVVVAEEGNELAISFWPNPADYEDAPRGDWRDAPALGEGPARPSAADRRARRGLAGEVVWEFETPTRLKVVHLDGKRIRPVAEVIGGGLRLPAAAREKALASLASLAGRLRVQGALDGAPAAEVEADGRVWIHLLPAGETLRVEALACPLGEGGPAFRPGAGGAAVFAERDGRRVRAGRDLAGEKRRLAEFIAACPSLSAADGYGDGAGEWRLADLSASLEFLEELQTLGDKVAVAWPRGGKFSVRKVRGPGAMWLRVARDRDWFGVTGGIEADEGLTLDMARLLELRRLATGRFLPLGNGEFLALTEDLRRRLDELAAYGEAGADGALRMGGLASLALEGFREGGVRLEADRHWRGLLERYREAAGYEAPLPPGLKAELRDYQAEGFRWLARLARWGVGACLADDMGLGKTVQALALLLHRAGQGPALVVAPMSVGFNWAAEAERFAPGLAVTRFGEGDRAAALAALKPFDLVIASYGLLQQEAERLAGVRWATVVLDEAQAIKNLQTKRSKAAMALQADFRFLTTGTPLENRLGELWNLFRFLNPGLLGSHARFQERFAGPIERDRDPEAKTRLRRLVRPFILRRTKAQVLEELPPRTEIDRLVEPSPEERAFYEALRRESVERLARAGEGGGDREQQRFRILAEIMKLRRACCNPSLVAGAGAPASAKLEAFLEILDELAENRHQALVFSQFVDHLALLRRALDARRVKYQYLDGGTPAKERQRAVQAFQAGEGEVFLISLKAGGLGLNLTAADYVIHMDPWWNPAVEDQASDRAHRIGQTRPVTVYRLVMRGSIEEKIIELHRSKRSLAEGLLSGASDASGRLDIEALQRLLREAT